MYRLASRQLLVRPTPTLVRTLKGPNTSQGHTTDKSQETLHGGRDPQSSSVRAGATAKNAAEKKSAGAGENEPFDAAKQGGEDGVAKAQGGTSGAFADQVGGQDVPGKGQGAFKAGEEDTAAGSYTDKVKKTVDQVKGGFERLKQMRQDERNFSTSARAYAGSSTPRTDPPGARKPVEKDVAADQNAHLKHSSGGSKGKPDQGNAAPDPHLPSKSSTSSGRRGFSTSSAVLGGTTPKADPEGAREPKDKEVKGDQNEHLKHSSGGSKGKAEQGNAAPDPHLPSQKGQRSFSTSARAHSTHPGKYAKTHPNPPNSEGYDVPSEALPTRLQSNYEEIDPNAVQPPPEGSQPSSKIPHSSTATGPPNEALRQAALDGKLGSRNPQPSAEDGKRSLDEAWKHRKVG